MTRLLRLARLLLLSCIVILSASPSAHAQAPQDLFGLGFRDKATAGASSAVAPEAWAAAMHNPAALADLKGMNLGFSWGYASFGLLDVNGKSASVLDAHGTDLGLALPLARFWKKIPFPVGLGLSLHLPDQFVVRMQAVPASEPRFILLDNYPHRVETAVGVGLAPWNFLHLGFGVQMLVHLQGDDMRVGIGARAGRKFGEMGIDTTIPYGAVPQGGIRLNATFLPGALEKLSLGLFWREPYILRTHMNIVADVDITGVVSGDTLLFLKMNDHFTPRKFSLALSFPLFEALDLFAGMDFLQWSSFDGGVSQYRMRLDFGINPPLVEVHFPADNFHDTWVPHAGLLLRAGGVDFAAGYAFVPSPVPDQTGFLNLLDNDRHVAGLGLGVHLGSPALWPHPVRLRSTFQYHHLMPRTETKAAPMWPTVSHGGGIFQAVVGLETDF